MPELAIQIQNLHFQYHSTPQQILTNLDLTVENGDSFGLFGPNGAGKTTLISLVTGVLRYKSGTIKIFNKEFNSNKKEMLSFFGLVPQSLSLYEELSPVQNLSFFGTMQGLSTKTIKKRTEELLNVLGLENVHNKAIKNFSGGMKRRVNLAIGVIHEPKLLFLDEPTVGVDVQTRHAIIQYLKELNKKGTTIFYTSHHLGEAQELCNQVALMDSGKILVKDSMSNLLTAHKEETLESLFLKLTGKDFRD